MCSCVFACGRNLRQLPFSLVEYRPTCFRLLCCVCLSVCVSMCAYQSRVPGTVIPLCAAQCERMFNTTRTPGEETGNLSKPAAPPDFLKLNKFIGYFTFRSDVKIIKHAIAKM